MRPRSGRPAKGTSLFFVKRRKHSYFLQVPARPAVAFFVFADRFTAPDPFAATGAFTTGTASDRPRSPGVAREYFTPAACRAVVNAPYSRIAAP